MKLKALTSLILLGLAATQAPATELKTDKDCVPGVRVVDRNGRAGTITAIDNGMCQVNRDEGTRGGYLVWMLRPEGAVRQADDTLVPGTYPCHSAGNYLFMDVVIKDGSAYRSGQGGGRYRLEKDGGIVFEGGPLAPARAKVLPGPRIGLNMDGKDFYNTSCSLKKG
ncbi:MAG TPA: hypothetical protein VLI06_04275 [Solimonas sp.]|nr:hypothetical protein [Solimonas sp.]